MPRLPLGARGRVIPFLLATTLGALAAACSAPASPSDSGSGQPDDATLLGDAPTPGNSAFGNYLAGRLAHTLHDGGRAADFYKAALAADPENVELLQRAFTLMAAEGRMDEAEELARRLLTFDSEAALATILVAVREARAGDYAGAEKRLLALPKRGLGTFVGPLLVAWTRAGQGRTEEAVASLAPLAANSHLAAMHDFHAGLINDLGDRRDLAEQHYEATLSSPGGVSLRAVQAVGAFYDRTGRAEKARAVRAKYTDQHPDSQLAEAMSDPLAANRGGRLVGSAREGLAEALFGAATSVRQGNALDLSLIFARMALDLQPDFPLCQMLVADILQNQGRLADANAIYRALAESSPGWWSAQLRVAMNLDEMGDTEGAIALLRQLADSRKNDPDPLVTLGEILRRHERFAEAAAAYDGALERIQTIGDHHWALFYSRGISLERSNQWQRAENDFLKALELHPDQPYVLNYLGYSWVEQGVNLESARRMIEKAVELRPDDGYIVDSLGWVLYRLGDYPAAVSKLERAVELRPEDATINDHLGDALWRVGRTDEARYQWQRALSLAKEKPMIEAIKGKLATGLDGRTVAGAGAGE